MTSEWKEDDLIPRVGYMVVLDPSALRPVAREDASFRSLRQPQLELRRGDLLHITIVANVEDEDDS